MSIKRPVPTGEYKVGTFTYTVDNGREEVMNPGTNRRVACRVYYPVLKESVNGMEREIHMSRKMIKAIKSAYKAPINYDKVTANGENFSECYKDAPRIENKKFPLVVFNHGYNSCREGNSFLILEMVSHGYVVISVSHSMEAVCTEFDDGSEIFYDKSIVYKTYQPFIGGTIGAMKLTKMKGTEEELAEKFDAFQDKYCKFLKMRIKVWKEDVIDALDYARKNLTDLIDFDNGIGASGHSFGGDLAYALCADIPDFTCGINIDGALFGDYKNTIMERPFLQISCEANVNAETRTYLRHTMPVYKVVFKKMQHIGFSDIKHLINLSAMVGKLNPDILHENICNTHLEFFDSYLKKNKEFNLKSNEAITVTKYDPDM